MVRLGLITLLNGYPEFNIVADCSTLKAAYRRVESLYKNGDPRPDIALLDIKMPDGDGVLGCQKLKKIAPELKVIALTAHGGKNLLQELITEPRQHYSGKYISPLIEQLKYIN